MTSALQMKKCKHTHTYTHTCYKSSLGTKTACVPENTVINTERERGMEGKRGRPKRKERVRKKWRTRGREGER